MGGEKVNEVIPSVINPTASEDQSSKTNLLSSDNNEAINVKSKEEQMKQWRI